MVTEEEVLRFQEITLRLYKRDLSFEEAEDQLSRMVTLFELLLKNQTDIDDPTVNPDIKVVQNGQD